MKRTASILLMICYLALGTGGLEYAHNRQHATEDAREDAVRIASGKAADPHEHDDGNCEVHQQLHLAFFFDGTALFVIALSSLIALHVLPSFCQIPRLLAHRIACRGPPSGISL